MKKCICFKQQLIALCHLQLQTTCKYDECRMC